MASKLTRIDRNRLGLAGIAVAVVLFLAVNMLAGTWLTSTRLDLTQDHLFTLSKGTKARPRVDPGADRSPALLYQAAG